MTIRPLNPKPSTLIGSGDRINAEAAFKKLSEAYEVLGDQAKRSEFDRWGMAGPQQAASSPGGFGFDDQDFGYDQDVGQNPGALINSLKIAYFWEKNPL